MFDTTIGETSSLKQFGGIVYAHDQISQMRTYSWTEERFRIGLGLEVSYFWSLFLVEISLSKSKCTDFKKILLKLQLQIRYLVAVLEWLSSFHSFKMGATIFSLHILQCFVPTICPWLFYLKWKHRWHNILCGWVPKCFPPCTSTHHSGLIMTLTLFARVAETQFRWWIK